MSLPSRRLYLTLKSSIAELFKAETRYLKASNQKESVFEKPYYDYEYQTMHLKIPKADWPTWYLPPWKARKWAFGQDLEGGALPTLGCPGCALYADGISNKCDKPVEIHSGIYCTNTPGASTDRLVSRKTTNYDHVGPFGPVKNPAHGSVVSGVAAGDTVLEVYAEKGTIKEVSVGAWAYIGPSAAVWVDPKVPSHRICGRMTDGAGSICFACVDVTCLVCDCASPPVAFTIASYDSTIDPGGSAYVTVSGGCEPYSYSVSGTGYTASGTGTVGTITSASGTCGVNYGSTATVTAKDFCGTEKTCIIRNTGGAWIEHCSLNAGSDDNPCTASTVPGLVTDFWEYELIAANTKWRFRVQGTTFCYASDAYWLEVSCTGHERPSCGSPYQCGALYLEPTHPCYPALGGCVTAARYGYYYLWECA